MWFAKLGAFIARGKTIMAVYSYTMMGLSIYATITKRAIDTSVAVMYGSAIAAYVTSKGHELYEHRQTTLQQYIEAQRSKT
jgi:hypothetical protein